ncbi:MAG: sugar phosphate isomerase/epimerase family protein [Verrucomicrobiales bacterium]
MPALAAFPKFWMPELCKTGTRSLDEWFQIAADLGLDGVEWYAGFIETLEEKNWAALKRRADEFGLAIPMMCCSPDFTHPDPEFRREQIEQEKRWIDMAYALRCRSCRVLSGQRRPEVSREEGIRFAKEGIEACLPYAQERGITLVIENHYKDDFWQWPEFAQKMDVFCELVGRIDYPNFGVNYDPSNTILAGEDPLELLRRVAPRVVTMHASDRYLIEGTIEDLNRDEAAGVEGYAKRLRHGEIGKGINDYDAIFSILKHAGFDDNWISIEDGVDGFEELAGSSRFLRKKIADHWPERTKQHCRAGIC